MGNTETTGAFLIIVRCYRAAANNRRGSGMALTFVLGGYLRHYRAIIIENDGL